MGVKISRGPSVWSTYGPEIVCLYSCAYEMLRKVSLFTAIQEEKEKKIISFTALFEHEALLSSPPPDLISLGSLNESFSAPVLQCACHFQ